MATFTRQPFAEIGTPRLQALQSAKNRQNAILPNFASPLKPSPAPSTGKRQRAPEIYEDGDSENIDPSIFNSPTKRSKTNDAGFVKPAKFSLFTSPVQPSISLGTSPPMPSIRKALSSPNTAKSTPITTSRGSPKHKRINAISKRRASSSPFRRVDPPSFTQSSPALPFSIDAALSGTLPTYTPKPTPLASPPPFQHHVSPLEASMPKTWFFAIHEDTPEQEAANLMEHSAAILDISSDDDVQTKLRNDELEKGKENIPPVGFMTEQPRSIATPTTTVLSGLETPETDVATLASTKRPRLRKLVQDVMDEDRKPLGDLPPAEFYAEGCDASSYVTVDTGMEKPSGLSREVDCSPEQVVAEGDEVGAVKVDEEVAIVLGKDEDGDEDVVVDVDVDVAVVVEQPRAQPQPQAQAQETPVSAS